VFSRREITELVSGRVLRAGDAMESAAPRDGASTSQVEALLCMHLHVVFLVSWHPPFRRYFRFRATSGGCGGGLTWRRRRDRSQTPPGIRIGWLRRRLSRRLRMVASLGNPGIVRFDFRKVPMLERASQRGEDQSSLSTCLMSQLIRTLVLGGSLAPGGTGRRHT